MSFSPLRIFLWPVLMILFLPVHGRADLCAELFQPSSIGQLHRYVQEVREIDSQVATYQKWLSEIGGQRTTVPQQRISAQEYRNIMLLMHRAQRKVAPFSVEVYSNIFDLYFERMTTDEFAQLSVEMMTDMMKSDFNSFNSLYEVIRAHARRLALSDEQIEQIFSSIQSAFAKLYPTVSSETKARFAERLKRSWLSPSRIQIQLAKLGSERQRMIKLIELSAVELAQREGH